MKYILFKKIDHHMSLVDALMETQFSKVNKIPYQSFMMYTYEDAYVSDLHVLFNDFASELLTDFFVYISPFVNETYVFKHVDMVNQLISQIPIMNKGVIDNKVILTHHYNNITPQLKIFILGKYHDQSYMLHTIQTYLESNQNMITASKELFIHRNTLMMRLEKFNDSTGFDMKSFKDGFLMYHLFV